MLDKASVAFSVVMMHLQGDSAYVKAYVIVSAYEYPSVVLGSGALLHAKRLISGQPDKSLVPAGKCSLIFPCYDAALAS